MFGVGIHHQSNDVLSCRGSQSEAARFSGQEQQLVVCFLSCQKTCISLRTKTV